MMDPDFPGAALDLFAGTGWGVALQARGIREGGVEIMPEAVASRTAAGMETIYNDVWDGLLSDDPVVFAHALEIASPPCQSFSMAGKGAGRAALDDVLRAIDLGAYRQPAQLRALGAETDERTALVLTPLAHVDRDRPTYIAWEQVPPVLPVWEACAEVMREMGYSVWTGVLRAEQYGVPQTRRRAVLIARADGIPAAPPRPTHSRYYEREPQRLDPGVLPWVSMADALDWHPADLVGFPRRSDGKAETVIEGMAYRARDLRAASEPAQTVTEKARSWQRIVRQSGDPVEVVPGRSPGWVAERPSPTIVGSFSPDVVSAPGYRKPGDGPRQKAPGSVTVTESEAAVLQSFPSDFAFQGSKTKRFLQIGNAVPPLLAGAIIDGFF
jgi:DNA (cytosine-5)-methyltransferase 1